MNHRGRRVTSIVAVAVAAALSLTSTPAGAAATPSTRTPAWESGWASEDPYEDDTLWYKTPRVILDPATGDVAAIVEGPDHSIYEMRVIDGATGATKHDGPTIARFPDGLPTTAPGTLQQFTRITSTFDQEVWASAISFQGTYAWARQLTHRGEVLSRQHDPATGTTCATIDVQSSRLGALACVDRNGEVLFETTFRRPPGGGGPLLLAADPARSRWYVADSGTKDRTRRKPVTRTVRMLWAFDEDGTTRWTRRWTTGIPRTTWGGTDVLTVDPRRGRVLLGTFEGRSPRIRVWDRRGRAVRGTTWRGSTRWVRDVVVSHDGRRTFILQTDARSRIFLVALRPDGTVAWQRRHGRSGKADYHGVSVVLASDRQRVLVVGTDVAAYDWKGRQRWRGRTKDGFLGSRGLYDETRGRFVVPWTDTGYPRSSVVAFDA